MGVFRPLIDKSQGERTSEVEPSSRWLTPANVLTASRPLLAAQAARMLIKGQRGSSLVVAGMAATDMEGSVARAIDKKWPESGLGTSTKGAEGDKYADALALLTVSGAALLAPKVSPLGKAAVGTVLAQEGYKTVWAAVRAAQYANKTGELLEIPTDMEGKEAMAEKFVAIEAAVMTAETDNPYARLALGSAALGFALAGSWRGEKVRQRYDEISTELMAVYSDENYPGYAVFSNTKTQQRSA